MRAALELHPEIAGYLNALSAKLDSASIADLNGMVGRGEEAQ